MDGTPVDTEPYWIRAEHGTVESYGGTWSDELAHRLVGNALLASAWFIIEHLAGGPAGRGALVHRPLRRSSNR